MSLFPDTFKPTWLRGNETTPFQTYTFDIVQAR